MLDFLKRLLGRFKATPPSRQAPLRTALAGQHVAETALRKSEDHFLHLVAGVIDYGIFLLDAHGTIRSWNAGAERLKGYRAEEVIGQHFSRFYPPEAIASGWPAYELQEATASGRFEDEGWRLRKDGSRFWANVVITALKDESGTLRGFLKITRDLTERKHAEAKLRLSEERFRLMVDGVQDYAIFMLDPKGNVTTWNAGAQRIKGYRAEEIIGQHLSRFIPPEEAANGKPARELEIAAATGKYEEEGWRLRKDGSRFWAGVVLTALRDPDGQLRGYVKVTRDLSQRKAAEESLRQSEERFRLLVESTTDYAIFMLDPQGRIASWNAGAERLKGWSASEIIGQHFSRFYPQEAIDRGWPEHELRVAAQVGRFEDEGWRLRKDGSRFWANVVITALKDEADTLAGFSKITRDLTQRKQAEEDARRLAAEQAARQTAEANAEVIRAQREQLRVTLESIGDGVIVTDAEGTVTLLNRVAQTLTGWKEDVTGRPLEEVFRIFNEETHHPVENPVAEVLREGRIVGLANHTALVAKDGTERPIDDSAAPIKNPQGQTIGAILVFRDVSERRRAEQALRLAEQRWRTMAEALPNLVWTDPPDGQCDWLSSQWRKYTGIPEEELLGMNWLERVIHPDDRERTLACWQAACADQGDYDLEYRIRRHDGEYHWFKTRGVPIRDEQGKITYWFGTCTDIEDRKRAEDALKDAHQRKDEFLATLAHELRNPLAPLGNALQTLKIAHGSPQVIAQTRDMMERQLGQMVRLVDDLLDVSRITRGKIVLRKEPIGLAVAIQSAVETSRPLIEAHEHELAVTLPPEPIYVDADLVRLAQVFSNLLNNSAKYTSRGGRIWLTVERQGRDAVVRVGDNGMGIPPTMMPRVFEMFTQADRTLEKSQGGLGIGLTLVKRLVEMHGGTVEAHSEGEGRGSEFVIRLPPVFIRSAPETEQAGGCGAATAVHARHRILVVDDNEDSANSLALMLRIMGHEAHVAHDGLAGVEAAARIQPAVVFLDIGMPKLNGYDAARRLRELPGGKNTLLVAVTGWGQEEDKRRSQEAGFDQHLVKPMDPAALEALLAGLEMKAS